MAQRVIIIDDPNEGWGGGWAVLVAVLLIASYLFGQEPTTNPPSPKYDAPETRTVRFDTLDASEIHRLNDAKQYRVYLRNCMVIKVDTVNNEVRLLLESRGAEPHNIFLATTRGWHPSKWATVNVRGTLVFKQNSDGTRGARLLQAQFD